MTSTNAVTQCCCFFVQWTFSLRSICLSLTNLLQSFIQNASSTKLPPVDFGRLLGCKPKVSNSCNVIEFFMLLCNCILCLASFAKKIFMIGSMTVVAIDENTTCWQQTFTGKHSFQLLVNHLTISIFLFPSQNTTACLYLSYLVQQHCIVFPRLV